MKKAVTVLFTALTLFTAVTAQADTIELADGRLLEGDFIGSSNGIIMFDTGGGIEAFPEDKVVGLFLSAGVATKEAISADSVTVPTGTRLVIRTSNTLDTSRHAAGHRFTGQLEGALVVDGVTVARRGAYVHGRIVQADQARRLAGTSELAIEFSDIVIDEQLVPIVTTDIQAQSGNEVANTAGRTARAAAIGGLIGGGSGARTGALVGVGASILTRGTSINIPAGTILETTLAEPLTVQL
ncbi:MAG: hypothetical protein WBN95_03000 [Gammaproteobacteria bacterium]